MKKLTFNSKSVSTRFVGRELNLTLCKNKRAPSSLLVVMLVVGLLVPLESASAAESEPATSSYSKLTPWGDPDLQGVWSYASLTPLQRPRRLEDKEFYTAEEAAEINERVTAEQAPVPGQVGDYNVIYYDRGNVSSDLRTSLIVDPPNGRLPLRQETIQKQAEQAEYRREHPADSWLDRSNWDRCITYHGVPPISTGYNNSYQIVQNSDFVAIFVENIHDVRLIPLDGREKLSDKIRQWNGASVGYWEGNTLVVETSNFSDKSRHRFPSSKNMRSVERFTRVGEKLIDYKFTIEDPEVYTSSWSAIRPMPALEDYVIYEYACHEGNYAMSNILRGERVLEQRAAEAARNN